ncbi:class I SAM-dependent methyltransferase [Caproiciproducens sp. NJN-50]|uniref:class I SAM-dependent methyltransferase n=1 Tax=Caproiciproducens sp. NJN-50 TaxID=2507162 RepID=UPI0013E8D3EA|nr:class I SAM-dependent methyltransferase [Caproiciproducens sp. NJN-50]
MNSFPFRSRRDNDRMPQSSHIIYKKEIQFITEAGMITMKYDFHLNMDVRRSQTVILKMVKPQSTVLELGCYSGIMTNYMKNQLGCKVYVCEIDSQALQFARQFAQDSWEGDIETLEWTQKFKDVKFDCAIFADVLEHLKDPAKVLKAAGNLLKDDGSILISVPNVAHNSVIYGLLHNQFQYAEYGLLDQTHLRFYTYFSLKKMCAEAGFTPVTEDAINEYFRPPFADQLPESYLNQDFGNIFQFIFELKKTEYVAEHKLPTTNKISNNAG